MSHGLTQTVTPNISGIMINVIEAFTRGLLLITRRVRAVVDEVWHTPEMGVCRHQAFSP